MLDLRLIREDPAGVDAALARRGAPGVAEGALALDAARRAEQTRFQTLQQERNDLSRRIGRAKGSGEDPEPLMARVNAIKGEATSAEEKGKALGAELDALLAASPNLPDPSVPDGRDEHDNVELRRVGSPPAFDFPIRDHADIGTAFGLMDFERASRLSGARFVVLKGTLARMERALAQFMLDVHTGEFGYTEVRPPLLVRDEAVYGTGQLPKFAEDLFRTTTGHWLIPTAEVPLTNLVAGEILDEAELPLRFTAYTPCFRSEAGSAGKDTRGMIRQHQFGKVELVSIVHPDRAEEEHERMTRCAETILERLGLAYRTVLLCAGDMGFSARKTYDIEVWIPAQGTYREISSCSNCGDFQARRMGARFRRAGAKGTEFVHTLNGSGLAVGRTMVAILENYQRGNGQVAVPEALRPYMGGAEAIGG